MRAPGCLIVVLSVAIFLVLLFAEVWANVDIIGYRVGS